MPNRFFSFTFSLIVILGFFIVSCTKLDTTTIGSDLIPDVDNINTFADTLDLITVQGVFDGVNQDSTKLNLSDNYIIGKLYDPLLGSTEASLFLQLKPSFYPYHIGVNVNDSIVQIDSVVLCLSYRSFWGDSLTPIQLKVYDVPANANGLWDSINSLCPITYSPGINTSISATKSIDIPGLKAYTKLGTSDSVNNQIRIKLSNDFRDKLFSRDTVSSSPNNAFKSDSLFRLFNNGFAIVANSGNGILYVNILDDKTRLELHYKKKSMVSIDSTYSTTIDTVYSNFYFNAMNDPIRRSFVSNKITRTRNGLPSGDQELVIQASPGTFATIRVPALDSFKNRIIHRAELQIQQIPDLATDKIFTEPNFLYLDLLADSATNKYKPVYFDLNPNTSYDPDFALPGYPFFPLNGNVDIGYFGGNLRKKYTPLGEQSYYNFNLTRYIQQIATKHTTNFKIRLFAPHSFVYSQYSPATIPYANQIGYGRVKVGGGNNPNPGYRMRIRVVYSNIK